MKRRFTVEDASLNDDVSSGGLRTTHLDPSLRPPSTAPAVVVLGDTAELQVREELSWNRVPSLARGRAVHHVWADELALACDARGSRARPATSAAPETS